MIGWGKIARRIRVPLGFALVVVYLYLANPTWRSLLWGSLVILPGLLVRARASGHVRKNEALATSGPYAYTRNPLYAGSLLIGVGFAVASRSWWIGLALAAMFFAIYLPVIRDEESFLRDRFPEFAEYARQVPRMLPRLTPSPGHENDALDRFSFDLYLKHREYNAAAGTAVLVLVLIAKMIFFRK
jgi:protein-S-isoprenylcysteine O-methyltransferase Ste14